LHVTRWDAGVESRGDERVPQRVWADRLGDTGTFGDAAHGPPGAVPVPALPTMRIGLISLFVDDQDEALRFYTEVLGLRVKDNAHYKSREVPRRQQPRDDYRNARQAPARGEQRKCRS